MRAIVLGGCGAQGSVTTQDLVKRDVFDEVVIADLDVEAANRFARALESPKVSTRRVDVLARSGLVESIRDADLVVNCTGPYYLLGPTVVDAAIEAGKPYIDFCDDVVAHRAIYERDALAKEKGLTILVGLGCSPGIAPLMVMQAAEEMDEVQDVFLPQLVNEQEPEGPAVLYHMIENFVGQVPCIRDGKLEMQPAFEGEEVVDFGPPLGSAKVSTFGHPEVFTLPRVLPRLRNLAIKLGTYPPQSYELLKLLAQIGLASPEPIRVKSQDVAPRDFLISFLSALPRRESGAGQPDVSSMIVQVKGRKAGSALTIRYEFTGHMGPATGLPCSVGAEWIVSGRISQPGVVFPEECIDPRPFLDEVLGRVREISELSVHESTIATRDRILGSPSP